MTNPQAFFDMMGREPQFGGFEIIEGSDGKFEEFIDRVTGGEDVRISLDDSVYGEQKGKIVLVGPDVDGGFDDDIDVSGDSSGDAVFGGSTQDLISEYNSERIVVKPRRASSSEQGKKRTSAYSGVSNKKTASTVSEELRMLFGGLEDEASDDSDTAESAEPAEPAEPADTEASNDTPDAPFSVFNYVDSA